MRKILLASLAVMAALMVAQGSPAQAQTPYGNYVPMGDPSTLPQVPGCTWFPDPQFPGMYQDWCGSDELGWYSPYDWYLLTGIWPPDYGLLGG